MLVVAEFPLRFHLHYAFMKVYGKPNYGVERPRVHEAVASDTAA
jgi:hypothetical protein